MGNRPFSMRQGMSVTKCVQAWINMLLCGWLRKSDHELVSALALHHPIPCLSSPPPLQCLAHSSPCAGGGDARSLLCFAACSWLCSSIPPVCSPPSPCLPSKGFVGQPFFRWLELFWHHFGAFLCSSVLFFLSVFFQSSVIARAATEGRRGNETGSWSAAALSCLSLGCWETAGQRKAHLCFPLIAGTERMRGGRDWERHLTACCCCCCCAAAARTVPPSSTRTSCHWQDRLKDFTLCRQRDRQTAKTDWLTDWQVVSWRPRTAVQVSLRPTDQGICSTQDWQLHFSWVSYPL